MAGLLNDLYSLGKTPALWGGEGDGGLQHVTPGLPNQLLCWQTCTLYFIDCEIFQVVYIVQIRRLSLYGDYMIWILNEFLKIHLSKGGKCHGGRGGGGGFTNISPGLPHKQTSFLPRTRNDMRSVFASTRQLSTVITRNQIMDLINYLSAEEWQIAEGGNLEGTEMVVTLNQMDQTHTVQHWVLP